MRKALIVGIDHYSSASPLYGCVNDAHSVRAVLERHGDGSVNFSVRLMTAASDQNKITRTSLRKAVDELFSGDSETAMFYFAGHGYVDATGGYLCSSDVESGDDGLSLDNILVLANKSHARNKIIVLDSCHSGIAGSDALKKSISELSEGMTILTASTAEQYASEENGGGIFTSLFVDALSGAAANIVGDITPGSVYAHIDQSLGPWQQRPVFKTNVKNFVSLRKIQPFMPMDELRRITEFFPSAGAEYHLDPSYEPESSNPNSENTYKFGILQKFNRINLAIPVEAPHMYHAAMGSKSCKLTVLGEHYRRLIEKGLL